MTKLKADVEAIEKRGLYYTVDGDGRLQRFTPWLGDLLSFSYDFIMENSVFPKKFGGDIERHYEILTQELDGVRGQQVLELATGSGSAALFLDSDNRYTGADISPGLLRRAAKRFAAAGFPEPEFYVASADDLPFARDTFDLCLCILSMNFFEDVASVFRQVQYVLAPQGVLVCSVPVPERNQRQSTIRGALYSEAEWEGICQEHGFAFDSIDAENGALLYFRAVNGSDGLPDRI